MKPQIRSEALNIVTGAKFDWNFEFRQMIKDPYINTRLPDVLILDVLQMHSFRKYTDTFRILKNAPDCN